MSISTHRNDLDELRRHAGREWPSSRYSPQAIAMAKARGLLRVDPDGCGWIHNMAPDRPEQQVEPATPAQGTKADTGKLPLELLPTRPLEAIARVLAFGARKYAANNWRKGISYGRVYAAVIRHCWAWWRGENIDHDSGEHHLACAACELLFLLEYELSPDAARRSTLDDRSSNDIARLPDPTP